MGLKCAAENLDRSKQNPEKRLMAALLERSVRDYLNPSKLDSSEKEDLENWLFNDSGDWPFRARDITELLELDLERIRTLVLRTKTEGGDIYSLLPSKSRGASPEKRLSSSPALGGYSSSV